MATTKRRPRADDSGIVAIRETTGEVSAPQSGPQSQAPDEPPKIDAADIAKDRLGRLGITVALLLVYRLPGIAAAVATAAGANMRSVYSLHKTLKVAASKEFLDCMEALNVPISHDAEIFDASLYAEPHWAMLADLAGEEVDFDAWEAFDRSRPYHAEQNGPEEAAE